MRYLTYKSVWTNGEGYLPDSILNEKGYPTSGVVSMGESPNDTYVAVTSDDADLSGLEDYEVQEITQAQALELTQTIYPEAYLTEEGRISWPIKAAFDAE